MPDYNYTPFNPEIIFNDGTWCYDEEGEFVKKIDPGISPIIKSLPSCPPLKKIAGWGLAPKDQYFDALVPKCPESLQLINDDPNLTQDEKIQKLDDRPDFYKQEIDYILWHQKAIRDGWWFFNKGLPTPLTHDHVFYLTVWWIEAEHPEFRIRDWEVHWAIKLFCDDDPYCLGLNRPKERQIGETNIVSSARLRRTSTTAHYKSFMQSKEKTHAEAIHNLLIHENWRRLPFWLKPVWDGDANNVSEIRYFTPKFKGREGYGKKALNSILGYRDAGEKGLDGLPQIDFIHNDEIGKSNLVDVYARWDKQKYCLKEGAIKTGFALNTSTVDEMEFKGGAAFKKICDESHATPPLKQPKDYPKKTREQNNGFTISGLYNIFIPSNEGFLIADSDYITSKGRKGKRSIDKYGHVDLEWTTKALMAERKAKESGKHEDYLALIKERPLWWEESFLYNVSECHFNLKKIRQRLSDISYMQPQPYQRGNFFWVDGKQYGKVDWKKDDENGRWIVSHFLEPQHANRIVSLNGVKYPDNWLKFVLGCDPYKYGKKKGSDGGGAVMRKRDYAIDPDEKDVSLWQTFNIVCTYSYRHHNIDMYVDDMIMTCFYFGCKMSEETNFSILNKEFTRLGFANFLYKFRDDMGMENEQAGEDMQTPQKMEAIRELDDFIEKHCSRVNHPEVLEDCMNLQETFAPFDRLVSVSRAIKCAKEDNFFFPQNIYNNEPDKILEEYYAGYEIEPNQYR